MLFYKWDRQWRNKNDIVSKLPIMDGHCKMPGWTTIGCYPVAAFFFVFENKHSWNFLELLWVLINFCSCTLSPTACMFADCRCNMILGYKMKISYEPSWIYHIWQHQGAVEGAGRQRLRVFNLDELGSATNGLSHMLKVGRMIQYEVVFHWTNFSTGVCTLLIY